MKLQVGRADVEQEYSFCSLADPWAASRRCQLGVVCHERRMSCAARNCTRDEGGPFEFGNQEPISSHRKRLRAKAVVVSVAETPDKIFGRHGRERRAQANRCRSVESGLGDVRTGG
jgi:hypothetical protein